MVYVLDVVEFVEGVYEAFHFFSVFSREFDRVFRNHGDRCVFRFDVVVSQGFFDSVEGFRRGDDFVVFVGNFYVISTGIEGDFHDLVFIGLVAVDDEDARVVEHPADTARSAEVAAGFGEFVADSSGCAVAVIREDVDRNGNACRAVAFVYDFFVVLAFCSASAFLDSPFDVIFRDIVFLCFLKGQLQTHVADRVRTAHADSNRDFTADFGRDLTADCVVFPFFTFNIRPFRMSRHSNASLYFHQSSPARRSKMIAAAERTDK